MWENMFARHCIYVIHMLPLHIIDISHFSLFIIISMERVKGNEIHLMNIEHRFSVSGSCNQCTIRPQILQLNLRKVYSRVIKSIISIMLLIIQHSCAPRSNVKCSPNRFEVESLQEQYDYDSSVKGSFFVDIIKWNWCTTAHNTRWNK